MPKEIPLVARGSGRHYYYEINIGMLKFSGLVFKAEESVLSCVKVLEMLSEKLNIPFAEIARIMLKQKK